MDKTMHIAFRRKNQINEGQIQTQMVSIDETGRPVKRMLGAHYSEECMDELLEQMDKFLKTHSITTLLELVAVAIERKAEYCKDEII